MDERFEFEFKFSTTNDAGVKTMWVDYGEADVGKDDLSTIEGEIVAFAGQFAASRLGKGKSTKPVDKP